MCTLSSPYQNIAIALLCIVGSSACQQSSAQDNAGMREAKEAKSEKESKTDSPGTSTAKETLPKKQGSAAATAASVDDIVETPQSFFGKTVRVQGEVEEVFGGRSFTLDEDSVTSTDDLLVILPRAASSLGKDEKLTVTGPVQRFEHTHVTQGDYDGFDIDPELVIRHKHRPVILAESVRSGDKDLLATTKTDAKADAKQGAKPKKGQAQGSAKATTAKPVMVTPEKIARNAQPYFGKRVTVQGEIEDVLGPNAFTIDEDAMFAGPDLLVVTSGQPSVVTDGATVKTTGVLRQFVWTEFRRDYDWLEMDNDLVAAFESRPVLVADAVYRPGKKGASTTKTKATKSKEN